MKKCSLAVILISLFYATGLYAQSVPSLAHIKREKEYDVKFYFLDLDIEQATGSISGNVLNSAVSLINNLDTFAVQLDATLTIDSVNASLNNSSFQTATAVRSNNVEINVMLPFTAAINDVVQVRIYYHGSPTPSNGLTGLPASSFTSGSTQKFSESPPYSSYQWWPCKQDLTDKADSSWFFITTDSASMGMSNGLLTNVTPMPNHKQRWEWKSKYAIDFYLIAFDVGLFTKTVQYWHPAGRTDSMLLEYYNYSPPGNVVLNSLNIYSKLFGLYPFYNEKLGVAVVDLAGGMENQTMISLGDYDGVAQHEIAHQWFGDNATCGSWKDVFMNESFARWCESIYGEFTSPSNPDSARISHCNAFQSSAIAQPQGSVYGPPDTTSILGVFGNSDLYYDKGAMVINSLRFEINNDSIFFLGLQNYQNQFRGKSALASDLKAVMEATTGQDFTDFFNQWYYGFGYPTFKVQWNQKNDELMLNINETTSCTKTPLFKTSLEIKAERPQGDTVIRMFIPANATAFNFQCTGTITGLVIDPNQWISNGASVVYDSSFFVSSVNPTPVVANDIYTIYPNPTSGNIYIHGNTQISKPVVTELYNTVGQLVFSTTTVANEQMVLPGNIADGIYILRINQSGYFKIVVAR